MQSNNPQRLKILNDFAFFKVFGEKGDERQLRSFLNAVLNKTGKGNLKKVKILEARDINAINIIEFDYFDKDDFHLSFHLWEDTYRDLYLSDVCEIHFLIMPRFREFRGSAAYDLEKPLHR